MARKRIAGLGAPHASGNSVPVPVPWPVGGWPVVISRSDSPDVVSVNLGGGLGGVETIEVGTLKNGFGHSELLRCNLSKIISISGR